MFIFFQLNCVSNYKILLYNKIQCLYHYDLLGRKDRNCRKKEEDEEDRKKEWVREFKFIKKIFDIIVYILQLIF